MDDMSTTTLPAVKPWATPVSPNSTSATSGVSGTIVMMMSARCATPLASRHWVAVLCAISSGILPREKTNNWWPAFIRWQAMGVPMMPRPMKPIRRGWLVMTMSL
jgi:hypothetical protein